MTKKEALRYCELKCNKRDFCAADISCDVYRSIHNIKHKPTNGIQSVTVVVKDEKQKLLEDLALLVHCGGWANLTESQVLFVARLLLLPYWDRSVNEKEGIMKLKKMLRARSNKY